MVMRARTNATIAAGARVWPSSKAACRSTLTWSARRPYSAYLTLLSVSPPAAYSDACLGVQVQLVRKQSLMDGRPVVRSGRPQPRAADVHLTQAQSGRPGAAGKQQRPGGGVPQAAGMYKSREEHAHPPVLTRQSCPAPAAEADGGAMASAAFSLQRLTNKLEKPAGPDTIAGKGASMPRMIYTGFTNCRWTRCLALVNRVALHELYMAPSCCRWRLPCQHRIASGVTAPCNTCSSSGCPPGHGHRHAHRGAACQPHQEQAAGG